MPISKFKATCLSVMQRVKRTGRRVLITRYCQPVADVVPPSRPSRIGRRARAAIARARNEVWLSPISVWELLMLAECGRVNWVKSRDDG